MFWMCPVELQIKSFQNQQVRLKISYKLTYTSALTCVRKQIKQYGRHLMKKKKMRDIRRQQRY